MEKTFKKDEISIIYKVPQKGDYLQIFGKNFVKINKNNCVVIYDNKEIILEEKISINNNNISNLKNIKIVLRIKNKLTNISYMFNDCPLLLKIEGIERIDTSSVKDISFMFKDCISLGAISNIDKMDISYVTNMSELFCNCTSLESLPDIGKWNTNNVINMKGLFTKCSSLKSLPDISNWKTY